MNRFRLRRGGYAHTLGGAPRRCGKPHTKPETLENIQKSLYDGGFTRSGAARQKKHARPHCLVEGTPLHRRVGYARFLLRAINKPFDILIIKGGAARIKCQQALGNVALGLI